jgi:predicted small integral membrane protein
MKSIGKWMEERSTTIILVMVGALPFAIVVGVLRDFHWGYLSYCAQAVLLVTWRTLHDGEPRRRLYFGLVIAAIIHLTVILLVGEELRAYSSFVITVIFLADFAACTWTIGSLLTFDDDAESHGDFRSSSEL